MKKFSITVNGQNYDVEVNEMGGASAPAPRQAATTTQAAPAPVAPAAPAAAPSPAPAAAPAAVPSGATSVNAPMPGKVLAVKAKVGQTVKKGDLLLTLEAMKMENEIAAPAEGTVKDVRVSAGQTVKAGDVMVVLG